MNHIRGLKLLVSLIAVVLVCSCTESVHFTEIPETPAPVAAAPAAVSATSTPAPTPPRVRAPAAVRPPVVVAPPVAVVSTPVVSQMTLCQQFMDNVSAVDKTATNDIQISTTGEDITIDSARDVSINQYSGPSLVIKSAVSISLINNNSGKLFINTSSIAAVTGHQNGLLCAVADNIGIIDGVHGELKIMSQEIQELKGLTAPSDLSIVGKILNVNTVTAPMNLTVTSIDTLSFVTARSQIRAKTIKTIDRLHAPLHLYGTQVDSVTNNTSIICLHEGAKVKNPKGQVSANCPSNY
jgi:hypothetical protein